MIRIRFHDGRHFEITDVQAQALRDMKNSEKTTNLFTLTDHRTGRIICEEELRIIKGFDHEDPRTEERLKQEAAIRADIERRTRNRTLRNEWTDQWLKEQKDDGTIIEAYEAEARIALSGSIRKGYVGKTLLREYARMLIRTTNGCRIP